MPQRACFLDRDGVINVEKDYLSDPDLVELIPGVAEAIKRLKAHGFFTLVISNQGGVAKGLYHADDVEAVNRRIQKLLEAEGAAVDRFYYCPHHPDYTGVCDCRKPGIGQIMQAKRDFGIDVAGSFFVGDRITDIRAGRAAGCRDSILVRCGFGAETIKLHDVENVTLADDLLDAVNNLILPRG